MLFGCSDKNPDLLNSVIFDEEPTSEDQDIVFGKSVQFIGYLIVSDDNEDGIPNKGETVYIKIFLKNN